MTGTRTMPGTVLSGPGTVRHRAIPFSGFAFTLLVAAMLGVYPADAADWPQFRGPTRDGISTETGYLDNWDPTNLWTKSIGVGYSAASIANGRVYAIGNISGEDIVYCLDANTGATIWTNGYACTDADPYNGPLATPTVDGSELYTYSREGDLYCWDADTGAELWSKTVNYGKGGYDMSSSPLVEGNLVIVSTGTRGAAVDKRAPHTNVWGTSSAFAYSSPIAFDWNAQRHVVVFNDDGVYGINPANGSTRWSYNWSQTYPACDPIKYGDQLFITAGYTAGRATLINLGSGTLSHAWQNQNLKSHFSSCILQGQYMYGFHGQEGSADLVCIDLEDSGANEWTHGMSGGSLICADGRLIVLQEDGELGLITVQSSGYNRETDWHDVGSGSDWWTAPAMANGKIYCRRHNGTLACVRITDSVSAPASIAVSTTNVTVTCMEGTDADDATFQVWNSGETNLVYGCEEGSSRIAVSPTNGVSTGASDKQTHTITFNTSGLLASGSPHTRTITVRDDDAENSPVTVQVTINVQDEQPPTEIIAMGSDWKYRKGTAEASDPVEDWRQRDYDDGSWLAATAPFGYGDGPYGNSALSDMEDNYWSVYFRKEFVLESPATVSELQLEALYDDGFILWINGEEVARVNMTNAPGDFTPHNVGAASSVGNGTPWSNVLANNALPVLVPGTNVLAAHWFNGTFSSSDLTMDLGLTVVQGTDFPLADDADEDGLPDNWETGAFTDTDQTADTDFDGDGATDGAEFIAGTDADNSNEYFAVDVTQDGANVLVSFAALDATGTGYGDHERYYALEQMTNISANAWRGVPGHTNIQGAGQTVVYTNTSGLWYFYRGRVWLEKQ